MILSVFLNGVGLYWGEGIQKEFPDASRQQWQIQGHRTNGQIGPMARCRKYDQLEWILPGFPQTFADRCKSMNNYPLLKKVCQAAYLAQKVSSYIVISSISRCCEFRSISCSKSVALGKVKLPSFKKRSSCHTSCASKEPVARPCAAFGAPHPVAR